MSVETQSPKIANSVPSARPADIAKLTEAAEAEVAELLREHDSLALDVISGVPAAEENYQALKAKLATTRERLATLRAAHGQAVQNDEAAKHEQLAALRKTQFNAVRKHLEYRDKAALALTEAISEAAKQYHLLLDHSLKAQAACPIGMQWPQTELDGALPRLVANEMFKLSATPGNNDGRTLPGAQEPSPNYTWQPAAIPSIVDRLKRGTDFVIAKLKVG